MKLCIPVVAPNGLASAIEPHLPQAAHLLFFDTELRSCQAYSMSELSSGIEEEVLMDAVLCGSINRITLKTLLEQGIAVYGTDAPTAGQAIAQFEAGELQAAVLGGGCGGHAHSAGGAGHCCSGESAAAGSHGCSGGHGGCGGHGAEGGHKHDHSHAHGGGCCGSRAAANEVTEMPAPGDCYKIAVCSQNRKTVTEHAGKCRKFWVYDIEHGRVVGKNLLELPLEQSFHEIGDGQAHPLDEVDVLITGSIGDGLRQRLRQRGILGVVTSETDLDQAIASFLAGNLKSAPVAGGGCAHGCGANVEE